MYMNGFEKYISDALSDLSSFEYFQWGGFVFILGLLVFVNSKNSFITLVSGLFIGGLGAYLLTQVFWFIFNYLLKP